jgi:DNA replication and repair protein RecF
MDVLEGMMSQDASLMYERRKTFVAEFLPIFQELYAKLGRSETEQVDIQYTSHGARGNFEEIFRTGRPKERIVGHSLYGTHRDELDLLFNGFSVKHECSQGQTKTFFITMKLAQYLFLKGKGAQRVPILLLDDIFDKLDSERVERIINLVSSNRFGQIFITDTDRQHLTSILKATPEASTIFHVEDGSFRIV